ncbi:hypothetical protein OH76DRAFT_461305 [Lentinus brumalis]|uniref:Uncharacterized protein n=1 Tax=Lentinus brumalis TaxID=2498619 RepID=A0A371CIF7_9APHY|nr:hypothetical protein OH76DRAFT_461305 [Polyporus brumalis]
MAFRTALEEPEGGEHGSAGRGWTTHTRETRRYVVVEYRRVHSGFAGAQATSGPSRGRTKGPDHDAPSALLRTTSSALSTVSPSSTSRDSRALLSAFENGRGCSGYSPHVCSYSTLSPCSGAPVHRTRRHSDMGDLRAKGGIPADSSSCTMHITSAGHVVGRSRRDDLAVFGSSSASPTLVRLSRL